MTNLTRIGSGKYSDIFRVEDGHNTFAMKVSYYREETVREFAKRLKEGDEKGAKKAKDEDAITISVKFSEVAKKMKDLMITPHFIYNYESVDIKDFIDRIPVLHRRSKDLAPFQRKYNHVSFMELYDTDLTAFLSKMPFDDDVARHLIFQVVYSIFAAQRVLKDWRHNDLSTNNVLIKRTESLPTSYHVAGMTFFTDCRYVSTVIDYDFVHADVNRLRNNRVMSGRFKVSPKKNESYDVHFFLKSVMKCISKNKVANIKQTIKFIYALGLEDNDRCEKELPQFFPLEILKNPYFDTLRTPVHIQREYSIP
ncbi:serine/threonine-protein kinase [Acanthocystis turfacea Chlorella virus Can0610SP]|nr:serine/threonine-protein kinase [Acanthocystis turfacea Chlorella virus Can0610SP]